MLCHKIYVKLTAFKKVEQFISQCHTAYAKLMQLNMFNMLKQFPNL